MTIFTYPVPHGYVEQCQPVQVMQNGVANNAEVVVYTVGAGKVLWLTMIGLCLDSSAVAACTGECRIYDAIPALIHTLSFRIQQKVSQGRIIHLSPPFKLTAGQSIRVYSSIATLDAVLNIIGYEV